MWAVEGKNSTAKPNYYIYIFSMYLTDAKRRERCNFLAILNKIGTRTYKSAT